MLSSEESCWIPLFCMCQVKTMTSELSPEPVPVHLCAAAFEVTYRLLKEEMWPPPSLLLCRAIAISLCLVPLAAQPGRGGSFHEWFLCNVLKLAY